MWTATVSIKDELYGLLELIDSADPKDLQMLATIHTRFESLEQQANESSEPQAGQAARAVANFIESMVLDEVPDSIDAFQLIKQTSYSLKEWVDGQVELTSISFPPELKLPDFQMDEELSSDIAECVNNLAESLVISDLSDPHLLAEIHTQFESIIKWAAVSQHNLIQQAAQSAADLIEKLVLDEHPNPSKAIETLNRTISIFQSVICEERRIEKVDFPEELALPLTPESTSEVQTHSVASQKRSLPVPSGVDKATLEDFLSRQSGVLEELEELFLELEKSYDQDKIALLQRLIHTLKGEAGMLGFAEVEQVCHTTEDFLKRGEPSQMADCLLEVKDWLTQIFDAYAGKCPPPPAAETIINKLAVQTQAGTASPVPELKVCPPPQDIDYSIFNDFVCEALEHLDNSDMHLLTLENEPTNQESLNAIFRAFHTIKGVAGCLELGEIRSLAHEAESLLDRARKGDLILEGEAIDLTFSSVDTMKHLINHLRDSISNGIVPDPSDTMPILMQRIQSFLGDESPSIAKKEKTYSTPTRLREEAEQQIPLEGESASNEISLPASSELDEVPAATESQKTDVQSQSAAGNSLQHVKIKEIVKVDANRLDHLIETIGELVIAVSMVRQYANVHELKGVHLERHLRQLDKITRELQGMGTSLRMIPLRATFQKMARLVRDLSKKSNKPIEFTISGEETELDKAVVDRIGDPLVHMMRNAVDHGIEETPEERQKQNKPKSGQVELRAFHKGGNIYIEIKDDGRGLDREAILAKSRERGLIRDGENFTDREIFNMIFEPGFSTAKKVSEVSGRGVGMDVVKRNIESLRGQIDIRSEKGKGSVFTIRLPLTLAIIDGMVVRVGTERYILPTLLIVQSLQPQHKDLTTVLERGEMLTLQGRLVPIFRLGRMFKHEEAEEDPTKALVVVVEDNEKLAGLLVDELIGQQQIVIKPIGELFRNTVGISGGAILPDGRVGLILDVGGLVRLANEKTTKLDQNQTMETIM